MICFVQFCNFLVCLFYHRKFQGNSRLLKDSYHRPIFGWIWVFISKLPLLPHLYKGFRQIHLVTLLRNPEPVFELYIRIIWFTCFAILTFPNKLTPVFTRQICNCFSQLIDTSIPLFSFMVDVVYKTDVSVEYTFMFQ